MTNHIIGAPFPITQEQLEQDIDEAAEQFGEPFAQLLIEQYEAKPKPMVAVDMLIVMAFILGAFGGALIGIEIAILLHL